jgi:hypothetical protein
MISRPSSEYGFSYTFSKISLEKRANVKPFGTNNEESYTCGEGAILLPEIDETIVAKLAAYIADRADDIANDKIVVASPYTKVFLSKYTKLNVVTLEELAAEVL